MKTLLVGVLALIASIAGTADAYQQYVVNTKEINVRTRPINGHVLGTLRQGDEVTVYGTRAGWALLSQPGVPEQWVNVALLSPKGSGEVPFQSSARTQPMSQPPMQPQMRMSQPPMQSQMRMSAPAPKPQPMAPQASRSSLSGPLSTSTSAPAAAPYVPAPAAPASAPVPMRAPVVAHSATKLAVNPNSQIAPGAFIEASKHFSRQDIEIMRRGAVQMLETGRCQRIDFAYKSTINPSEYYVYCGNNRRVIFTQSDLTQ
jgi:hypothetical protein